MAVPDKLHGESTTCICARVTGVCDGVKRTTVHKINCVFSLNKCNSKCNFSKGTLDGHCLPLCVLNSSNLI